MATNVLSAKSVSKMFADQWLFRDISIGLQQGDKVGLVGINGAGKTTFLRILAGLETPDTGEVARSNKLSIGFLAQIPPESAHRTVWETVFESPGPELRAIHAYEQATLGHGDMPAAIDQMNALNVWNFESKVRQVLGRLGLHDTSQTMGNLSGGQRRRVALARTLLQEPDVYILDEPTNHLDIEVIEWLESMLSAQNLTLLVVSHDRYFLDKVTNTTWELDQQSVFVSKGNFSKYLDDRETRREHMQTTADKARKMYQRELVWLRRQPKARGTKSKSRIQAAGQLKTQAQNRPDESELQLSSSMARMGKKILELEAVSKAYGERKMLDDFTYTFRRGEKIGLIGPNGVGKTTFLQILTGRLKPDSGSVIAGQNTVFGYYEQQGIPVSDQETVIDTLQAVAEKFKVDATGELSPMQLLNRFLFPPHKQHDYVGKLSGGEKRRLQLLLVLVQQPNFLILDEPTNDLDIFTMEVLGAFLQAYQGCLLIASHDRFFMDQLVDHLFVFEGNGIISDFPGNYSGYRELVAEQAEAEARTKAKPTPTSSAKNQKSGQDAAKPSYKEKREYEQLEKEIEKLETDKAKLERLLSSGETNHEKLTQWSQEIERLIGEIETRIERWMELSEKIEGN